MIENRTVIVDSGVDKRPLSEKMKGGDLAWEGITEMAGWERLTRRQQAMIRASRMTQKQSERAVQERRGSHWSNTIVQQWFCHYSVCALECEEVVPFKEYLRLMGGVRMREFWGDYFENIEWFDDAGIFDSVSDEDFPQVVYIGRRINPGEKRRESGRVVDGLVQMKHSCVALGRNEEGDVMVWEKIAERYPFDFVPIQTVLNRYPKADRFAVRPLGMREKKIE